VSPNVRIRNVLTCGFSLVIIASMTNHKGSNCDSRFAVRNWRLTSHFLIYARLFLNINEANICWKKIFHGSSLLGKVNTGN
jgi:hypothetical protein